MQQIATTTFISSTFGGEAVSLAAASATLRRIQGGGVCGAPLDAGRAPADAFNDLAATRRGAGPDGRSGSAPGAPVRCLLDVEPNLLKGAIWQECLDRGILLGNANFVSLAHDAAAVDVTIAAFDAAMASSATHTTGAAPRVLRGPAPGEVFRRPEHRLVRAWPIPREAAGTTHGPPSRGRRRVAARRRPHALAGLLESTGAPDIACVEACLQAVEFETLESDA